MTVTLPNQAIPVDGLQYNFGPYCLRPDGTLLRNMVQISVPPRELSVLRLLLARAGQIVSAEELRHSAWAETHVSADSLPRCICSLRARLKYEDSIQTIYKRGYRFNIAVKQTPADRPGEIWTERRAARSSGLPRLAILPFTTGSGIPEFLGTGIAEETMLRLARDHQPMVEIMARDSVCNLVSRGVTALDVAKALRADMMLIGSVTALPQHFRLRAEMVRVADSVQLWIEDFLVPRNLLAYADARVAKRISARIKNSFGNAEHSISLAASASTPALTARVDESGEFLETKRSDAHSIFMQSRAQWNTLQRHLMQDAIRGFHQALDLDPTLIAARIHLVHSYLIQSYFGYAQPDVAAEMARKHADLALALSPNALSVHPALGWIYFHHDRDPAAADYAFSRPQGQGYNHSTMSYRVKYALGQRRFEDAIEMLRTAIEIDPFSPMLHGRLAWSLHLAGNASAALEQARRALNLFPDHLGTLFFSSMILAASDEACGAGENLAEKATALAKKLIQLAPSFDPAYAALAYSYARQGRANEARSLLERLQWLGKERYVLRSYQVPALVELGDLESALTELLAAERLHCPSLFEILADPRLEPLHDRSEFQRLLNRLGPMRTAGESVA